MSEINKIQVLQSEKILHATSVLVPRITTLRTLSWSLILCTQALTAYGIDFTTYRNILSLYVPLYSFWNMLRTCICTRIHDKQISVTIMIFD